MGVSFWPTFSRPDINHLPGGSGTAPNLNALDSSPTEYHCYSKQYLLCLSCEVLNNIMGAAKGTSVLWVLILKRDPHTPRE
jgi:hypothetical protein